MRKSGTEGSNPARSATQSEPQRNRAALLQKTLEIAAMPQFCLQTALEKVSVEPRGQVFWRFSLEGTRTVLFQRLI